MKKCKHCGEDGLVDKNGKSYSYCKQCKNDNLKGRKAWNSGRRGVYSKETIEKIRSVLKGRKLSKEHKDKIKQGVNKPEAIAKKVLANKKQSEKAKIERESKYTPCIICDVPCPPYRKYCSNKCKGKGVDISGENNVMYGKHHTEEVRRKISKSRVGKTKGVKLTKEHCENIRKSKIGEKNPFYGKKHSKETLLRISNSISSNPSCSRGKTGRYKGIFMRSSWETKVAKWLDDNHIDWEYETKNCLHTLSNGHTYIIDFYLPKLNKFIEVKGWWDKKSVSKYNEASQTKDMCIIDYRNIEEISLDIKEIPLC